MQMLCRTKQRIALCYRLCSYFTSKAIETAKEIGMYLL